jgi:NAD-dependent SIR2 family protein deacetylase
MNEGDLARAAEAVAAADAMLVGAGAGMGVDSGLPDFRGDQGFWKAYPPYAALGLRFVDMANPEWFRTDPAMAWGFYGHRFQLYRRTAPHEGFAILLRWAARMQRGAFVFTSNVDGHFQKAGFDPDRVMEVHGTLDWLQCTENCPGGLFPAPAGDALVSVDEATMRAREPLPACPECGALARPNVLMFGDAGWDESRTMRQKERLWKWWEGLEGARIVVVELGAGKAIRTVRSFCENVAGAGTFVRINPRDPEVPQGHLGIAAGSLEALRAIDTRLPQ